MLLYDERTGFPIADDEIDPFSDGLPSFEEVKQAVRPMILSASGWRKVFSISGQDEDDTPVISHADEVLASYAAIVFADYLLRQEKEPTVLVGIDARPTGPIIADLAIRMFLSKGIKVNYLFIAAAPEIMAENMRGEHGGNGFFYVSASHNPVGHNGFKFGAGGGVFPGTVTGPFADAFRAMVAKAENIQLVQDLSASVTQEMMHGVLENVGRFKAEALATYEAFILETAETSKKELADAMADHEYGIVADYNGSARADSIDKDFLRSLNIQLSTMNDTPRAIAHAIVPEGDNLIPCKKALEAKHKEKPCFMLGYVPDNDGDRGNIVVVDNQARRTIIPEAQEVFALVVMVTLAEMRIANPDARLAIAVNGPTSLRIDRIADAFDCKVFRSEVGEANVVTLAENLRSKGYLVKILGEGSNGGNITAPAKVRDPMNTIVTLLKLLGKPKILTLWCRLNKLDIPRKISIGATLRLLPEFTTTGAFSPDGIMHTVSAPGELKNRYEKLFLSDWEKRKEELASTYGICGYTVYQMEGTKCTVGMGEKNRHAPFKGGLKVCFTDKYGVECAFIWMRPSGTEPVFRVLADSEGNGTARHDYLLAWQRDLVSRADKG
jgi:phosphoglucomutase